MSGTIKFQLPGSAIWLVFDVLTIPLKRIANGLAVFFAFIFHTKSVFDYVLYYGICCLIRACAFSFGYF